MKMIFVGYITMLYCCMLSILTTTIIGLAFENSEVEALKNAYQIPFIAGFILGCIAALFALFLIFYAFLNKHDPLPYSYVCKIKAWLVPYYIGNFALWMFYGIGIAFLSIVWGIVIAVVGVSFTYLTMIATSSFNLCHLYFEYKEKGQLSTKKIFCALMQFVFCLDVLASVVLSLEERDENNVVSKEKDK